MDMTLTFENGVLQGEGRDDIDRFVLRGTYEANEAVLIKDYWGLPSVCHRGFRDGFKTALWGVWEIPQKTKVTGGFKIWSLGSADAEDLPETKAEEKPIKAVGNPVAVEDGKTVPTQTEVPSPNQQYAERLIKEDRILEGANTKHQ